MRDLPVMRFETPTSLATPKAVLFDDGSTLDLTQPQAELVGLAIGDSDVSPQEAARMLGVSRPMVVRWIREGLLEDRKAGTHHRIPTRSVQELMAVRAAAGRAAVRDVAAAPTDPAAARRVALARQQAKELLAARDNG